MKKHIHAISCTKVLLKRIPPIIELESEYVHNSTAAVNLFNTVFDMKDLSYEIFAAIYLSNINKINGMNIIAQGSGNTAFVNIREVFKNVLLHNASQIIIAHNHPSGNPSPSSDDFDLTTKVLKAAEFMNIRLADHIIISNNQYYSFNESSFKGCDSI